MPLRAAAGMRGAVDEWCHDFFHAIHVSSLFLLLQSNPYGLKDSGPTSDMSWTTAGLQPTTGYYSPYDPTLAAYGWVEICFSGSEWISGSIWNSGREGLRELSRLINLKPIRRLSRRLQAFKLRNSNGLLPVKGVDNRKIAIYHVIAFDSLLRIIFFIASFLQVHE